MSAASQEFVDQLVCRTLGSVSLPILCNSTSTNTGIYYPTSTSVGISISGSNIATFTSTGLGIGTTPAANTALTVSGTGVNMIQLSGTLSAVTNNPNGILVNPTFSQAASATYVLGIQLQMPRDSMHFRHSITTQEQS